MIAKRALVGLLLLAATPAWAQVSVDPPSIDFGSNTVGVSSPPSSLSVINSGNAAVKITSLAISGPQAGAFSVDNPGPFSVAGGSSMKVSLTFNTPYSGADNATLTISPNGLSPIGVPLKGSAVEVLTLLPPAIAFAQVPVGSQSNPLSVGLMNATAGPLTIGAINTSNPVFLLDLSNTKLSLMSNETTSLIVRFVPTVPGTVSGTINVLGSNNVTLAVISVSGDAIEAQPPDLSMHIITADASVRTLGGDGGGSCSVSRRPHAPLGCAVLLLLLAVAALRRRS
jgi:hypothetical protein